MGRDPESRTPDESSDGVVNRYWGMEETHARPTDHGLRPRRRTGSLAEHWWAGRWLRALTRWIDASRLTRGRQYARAGQVTDLHIEPGLIRASVQGTRPEPYTLAIRVATFSDAEWQRIVEALSQRALYVAQLLSGEMPEEIDAVLASVGLSLFPSESADIRGTCSCPDPIKPCKHIAAALMLVGSQLDEDPFLLFTLRGRTKGQLLDALRAQRALLETTSHPNDAEGADDVRLVNRLEDFWEIGQEAEDVHIRVAPAEIEQEVLRILGDLDIEGDASLIERLEQVYRAVSQRALDVAFGERRSEEVD